MRIRQPQAGDGQALINLMTTLDEETNQVRRKILLYLDAIPQPGSA